MEPVWPEHPSFGFSTDMRRWETGDAEDDNSSDDVSTPGATEEAHTAHSVLSEGRTPPRSDAPSPSSAPADHTASSHPPPASLQPAVESVAAADRAAFARIADTAGSSSAACTIEAPKPSTAPVRSVSTEVAKLIACGRARFTLAGDCTGGTYFVHDTRTDDPIAVFKPRDEEPGMARNPQGITTEDQIPKDGFDGGGGWLREIAAWRLDQGWAGVPETEPFVVPGELLHRRGADAIIGVSGSLQRFAPAGGQSWDYPPGPFPADVVRRIALLDLRLLNCDRHGGNLLITFCNGMPSGLVPIDHGYAFPASVADLDFEWSMWPQAKTPFTADELSLMQNLDPLADRDKLIRWGLGAESAELAAAAAYAVKIGTGLGMTAYELSSFFRRERMMVPSFLEDCIGRCRTPLRWDEEGGDIDFAVLPRVLHEELSEHHRRHPNLGKHICIAATESSESNSGSESESESDSDSEE